MRFSNGGHSLWFGTDDAPAPQGVVSSPQSIVVAVQPAHTAHRVDVRYRINNGLQRLLRTSLVDENPLTGVQRYRAGFPSLPSGAIVQYAPVLSSLGRTVDSLVDGIYPASFNTLTGSTAAPATETPTVSEARFPFSLELLFKANCTLNAELLGETPDGLRYDFFVKKGTLDGPVLRGKFLQGGDWMRVRRDGMGIPNIRVTLQMEDGAKVLMEAGGWFDFGPNGYSNAQHGIFAPSGNLMTQPTFLTSDPRYAWLMRSQCFGVGVVDMDVAANSFTLHDDVYRIVRPETPKTR